MSKLLDALIRQRRQGVLNYKEYLARIAVLTQEATKPGGGPGGYPAHLNTTAKRALYNNLGQDEALALAMDTAIQGSRMDGWRDNAMKLKKVRLAIKAVIEQDRQGAISGDIQDQRGGYRTQAIEVLTDRILELAKHQNEY